MECLGTGVLEGDVVGAAGVGGAGGNSGFGSTAGGGAGGGLLRATNTCFRGRAGAGMGDGFSRTEPGIASGFFDTGTGGLGASRATSRVGTSCGLTAKYTIPDASTAPVAKADASFQFKFRLPILGLGPPRLLL